MKFATTYHIFDDIGYPDTLLDVHVKYDGDGGTEMLLDGVDIRKKIVVERTKRSDVVVRLIDPDNDDAVLFHVYMSRDDYDIALLPDSDTIDRWRSYLRPYFGDIHPEIMTADRLLDALAELPVLDVWPYEPGDARLKVRIDLIRTLTMPESFTLARLNFDSWEVDSSADDYSIILTWR